MSKSFYVKSSQNIKRRNSMKKVMLVVALILVATTQAWCGDCRVTDDCAMWFDSERAMMIALMAIIDPISSQALVRKDISTGVAIRVNEGTRLQDVMFVPDTPMAVVKYKGEILVTTKGVISCR